MKPCRADLQLPVIGLDLHEACAANYLLMFLMINYKWILLSLFAKGDSLIEYLLEFFRNTSVKGIKFPDLFVPGKALQCRKMRLVQRD
jgi:hypothetical protein